jgi:hypothetical protein
MILLAKSFLKHYFFAVVQTASKPHPTRGQTTHNRACEAGEGAGDRVQGAGGMNNTKQRFEAI